MIQKDETGASILPLDQPPKRLFLDLSSSCSGWAIASFTVVEGKSTATIHRAGVLWFNKDWSHGQKYKYVADVILDEFYIRDEIVDIIYEKYSVNPKQMAGCLVVPELIGAIKAACFEPMGAPIGIEDMAPQSWRKYLEIKPVPKPEGGRDYKQPTIDKINGMFGNVIPKQIVSNITSKLRDTPHDLYDALGLLMGWHMKIGVREFTFDKDAFGPRSLE